MKSISLIERLLASLEEQADEALHINPCCIQVKYKRADTLVCKEYVWLPGKKPISVTVAEILENWVFDQN